MLFPVSTALANGDIALNPGHFSISDDTVVHEQIVKLYATVTNNSEVDLLGSVQIRNITTGNPIGSDQPISVLANSTDSVFVEWQPGSGTYTLEATVVPWDTVGDDPNNNSASMTLTVDYDFDNDGVGNAQDPDDDNDGVADPDDAFPLDPSESTDTDNDGTGNNADPDDDNDGVADEVDQMPQDPTESTDTDGDGIGNNEDDDDDNDGVSDANENEAETDPNNPDTDGDSVPDGSDAFPLDENEWEDTDDDGVGNNEDEDDENDGLADVEDDYPLNMGPVVVVDESTFEEDGVKYIILDASESYDPDGDIKIVRWFDRDGLVIREEAVFMLPIGPNAILPASVMIIDSSGEARSLDLNLSAGEYFGAMAMALLVSLLLALALILYLKYTSSASKKAKPVRQVKKKTPKKATKKSATTRKKSTKKPKKR
jgi:hypothetical protein